MVPEYVMVPFLPWHDVAAAVVCSVLEGGKVGKCLC